MTTELAKAYTPKEVEPEIAQRWTETRSFHAEPHDPADRGKPYCIVIPPPNVTAALHMGHALNNTLQDILIRHHRMLGDNTVWIPGTDHAGIATQTVVEKRILAETGRKRTYFSRDEFVAKIQAWKDQYEAHILGQLKAMGCSCDWDRTRFTMDPICAKAVREAFFKLFKDGLIYRGKRLVNWDPATQTALADDEVEMEEIDGHFYYLKYPLESDGGDSANSVGGYITVATTRPETMLGDTAVAINPRDPRAAGLRGKKVRLPIVNRVIPIIEDDYVVLPDPNSSDAKAKFATGFLKVTPAHDPNDYEIGQRHKLGILNILAPDGSISDKHGWPAEDFAGGDAGFLLGLDRFEARKAVVEWFRKNGLLEEVKPYKHSVGHSYRSHVPIEPYLSDQWYVKVTDDRLAGAALRAMATDQRSQDNTTASQPFSRGLESSENRASIPDHHGIREPWEGKLRFTPARYAKNFQTWHENIRDWCISRQLWWGHRIPVWHINALSGIGPDFNVLEGKLGEWHQADRVAFFGRHPFGFGHDDPQDALSTFFVCVHHESDREVIEELERHGFTQDPDVLDTWFSSALWPFSTLGWPDNTPELQTWNPGNVLCTAREIITLWVSRMVMLNLYLLDRLPFTDVFIHAMIQDGEGQKMSKSLGNGVDPIDIIHSHGSDAMRFTLAVMTTDTQDVRMPVSAVCPHCAEPFVPEIRTIANGYRVAPPKAACPKCKGKMLTSYGYALGEQATAEQPLARNTSDKFDLGRNFANKLWNATRFALANLEEAGHRHLAASDHAHEHLALADRWILSRLAATVRSTNAALANYQFSAYAQGLYDFIWRDLCDWYIEAIKPTVKTHPAQCKVLSLCIDAALRLLHPAMPFITEKLWEKLNDVAPHREISGVSLPPSGMLVLALWPHVSPALINEDVEAWFTRVQNVVGAIREVRTTYKIPPRQRLVCSFKVPAAIAQKIFHNQSLAEILGHFDRAEFGPGVEKPANSATAVVGDVEIYIHDLVDPAAEVGRLNKRIDELTKQIGGLRGRLENKSYIDRAPAHLVQETRNQLVAAERELGMVQQQLAAIRTNGA